ncbi:hypothetical protein EDD11_003865 [Mortierella claussenii]|nr:hypothetical protein EDD11_003865 [Mortierella claussenii]
MANLSGADHAINGVLLTAVLSAGQSSFYASTRTLMAMGCEGKMPAIFGHVNSRGMPLYALTFVTAIASIAFVADVVGTGLIFEWLVNLTGMSALLIWMSISIFHLSFRAAFKAQDRPPFRLALRGDRRPVRGQGCSRGLCGRTRVFMIFIIWKVYHKTRMMPLLGADLYSSHHHNICHGRNAILENSPKRSL